MILVNLNPYMIRTKVWNIEVDLVLNKYFDWHLIQFIKDNNLQLGDNIIEKQEQTKQK